MRSTHPHESLASRATSSAAWMASQTIVARIVGFLVQIAIAKLLVPEQVGLIALVTSITIISRHLMNPGIDEVLLTKKARIHRWLSAAF